MVRRLILLVGVCVLLTVSSPASADINTSLQNMFNGWGLATATRPGAYQSQAGGSLVGGSISMRFPNQGFDLINIAPPRFRLGCQGVDFYLGAISFPSLSRFTDLLQQLGTAGVLGFAFQLALMELCQPCENIISKLEAAARAINTATRLGPCQMGQELAKMAQGKPNAVENVTNAVADAWSNVQEAGGAVVTKMDSLLNNVDRTPADAATALAGTPDDIRGNLVFRELVNSGWSADDARMIMSLIGTVVVGDNGIPSYYPPLLNLADIVEPRAGVDTIHIYQCNDTTDCLVLTEVDDGTYQGFRTRAEVVYDSIVQKVTTTKVALSPEEVDLVNRSPIPFYRLLLDYGDTPELAQVMRDDLAELLGVEMAYVWMAWAYNEALKHVDQIGQDRPRFVADIREFRNRASEKIRLSQQYMHSRLASIATGMDYTAKVLAVQKNAAVSYKKKRESRAN
jgi:conjugative transfer pilus assembly protein TraH